MMNIFDDLKARDLVAQVTNEERVREILNTQKVNFYIGFEPTADSLHVGHFTQIMIMSRLQKAGHVPIILFGGATALIGDPSGKTDMRRMMTQEEINHNISCFKKQAEKFIDFENNKAIIVNNYDWLSDLNYIKFLREIGVHFSVNRMLAAECYKQRLERGLTFFELNYMIMQSYDFLVLNQKYNCNLQLGGDDQWSNIIGGVELIRRVRKKEAFGLTFKLLVTSEGKKMGKTEKGAVWLDRNKTSPYEFYQYWRNIHDNDVINCLNMLTFLPTEQINSYKNYKDQEINKLKEILAFELTKIVHSEQDALESQEISRNLFDKKITSQNMPEFKISRENIQKNSNNNICILDLMVLCSVVDSKKEARRLIEQNGIHINSNIVTDINHKINITDLESGVILQKGKKYFLRIIIE
ncbi:MAG: tyrosine--tRNA ligase [Clostridia bacterium]|nr:tyrosine--tRNA ligase [Clostridia bacterium]